MANIKKQLGKKIKYFRKMKGFSQEDLSEKLGLTTRSLSNIETGRFFMSLSNLEKLMDVLDVEPYELFIFDKNAPEDVIFDDIINRLEKFKNNIKKLRTISAFIDCL